MKPSDAVTLERDPRGWWEFRRKGRATSGRLLHLPDYRATCSHSEQSHNTACSWCGETLR